MWGHFQLQAGTLTSAKAALGERKPSARGCLSFQQLPGEMPNIEMHLTQRCTTRTHHPTPRSSQALTPTRASLQEPLNSQTKQLPAPMEQENPTGGPGRRLGWRGHIIIPNAQQPSPLRQRGCTYSPADAAPKPNTPPFTPPSLLPKTKHTPRNRRKPGRKNPTVTQQLFQAFPFPGGGNAECSGLGHVPPQQPRAARCPWVMLCWWCWGGPPSHSIPCTSQLALQHTKAMPDFSLLSQCAWKCMTTSAA